MSDKNGGYDIAIDTGKKRRRSGVNTLLMSNQILMEFLNAEKQKSMMLAYELAKTKAELKLAYDQLEAAIQKARDDAKP